jgi:hypothetical protein
VPDARSHFFQAFAPPTEFTGRPKGTRPFVFAPEGSPFDHRHENRVYVMLRRWHKDRRQASPHQLRSFNLFFALLPILVRGDLAATWSNRSFPRLRS